jgi:hypothetical protein
MLVYFTTLCLTTTLVQLEGRAGTAWETTEALSFLKIKRVSQTQLCDICNNTMLQFTALPLPPLGLCPPSSIHACLVSPHGVSARIISFSRILFCI